MAARTNTTHLSESGQPAILRKRMATPSLDSWKSSFDTPSQPVPVEKRPFLSTPPITSSVVGSIVRNPEASQLSPPSTPARPDVSASIDGRRAKEGQGDTSDEWGLCGATTGTGRALTSPGLIRPTPKRPSDSSSSGSLRHFLETRLSLEGDAPTLPAVCYSDDLATTEFRGHYDLVPNTTHPTEYGRGLWCVVYQATYWESSAALLKGDLPDPDRTTRGASRIIAVKTPQVHTLVDAKPILLKEARILTYLHSQQGRDAALARRHIVPFLGREASTNSLFYEALPLTLRDYSAQRAQRARDAFSTRTMTEPVVGSQQWLHFARRLVGGLVFLHGKGVFHGDIKPSNILLRINDDDPPLCSDDGDAVALFDPVYCDFSSSRVEKGGTVREERDGDVEEVSAVSTAYTAPELLAAFHRRDRSSTAARSIIGASSDVFALGATLVVPACGGELYGDAQNSMQRLMLAQRGQPLAHAQEGDQATRVAPMRLVERSLGRAALANAGRRWQLWEWAEVVEAEWAAWEAGRRDS
ncbi:MAG: hypothetical protein M1832_006364 [Thelocarpon impressellum]|nr:MAG: hypothetical protein M1832_006364 [Thelocarpon impressellum]